MRAEIKKIKLSLKNNDLKTAAEQISKAHRKSKNHPLIIALEGIYYTQTGNLEQALAAFSIAAQSMPRDPTLFYNIAVLLKNMGRMIAAEEAIRRSLRLRPENSLALFELAQILALNGKHNEAILALLRCIQNFNLFFPAYVALSQYLLLDGQDKLAVQLYEAAVKGAPQEKFFQDRLAELKGL